MLSATGLLAFLLSISCGFASLLSISGGLHRYFSADRPRYNSLFSFGDSLADTGNTMIASLPYGMTFFRRFTGRCSDGRLVIDFLAEGIGLPYLPANSQTNQSFHKGVNFAVTAATTLDQEFFQERNISKRMWVNASLHRQIDRFEKLLPSICGSPQDCNNLLSKSLFVVGEFGGNDYNTAFSGGKKLDEVITYVPFVIKAISDSIERLISVGARDVIVPNLLPIGCFPLYLSLYGMEKAEDYGPKTGCLRVFNALSWHHNLLLARALTELRSKYNPKDVSIRLADYYSQVLNLVLNPLKHGFSSGALRSCCGAPRGGGGGGRLRGEEYNFNIRARCGNNGSSVCEDPSKHVSWDGIHFTEAANRIVAQGWLHGPYVNPPILIT